MRCQYSYQQLIKNNVFPNFVSENTFSEKLERKIQEQYLALKIEKQMSKDEILECYMNTINIGQNTLGVQALPNAILIRMYPNLRFRNRQ